MYPTMYHYVQMYKTHHKDQQNYYNMFSLDRIKVKEWKCSNFFLFMWSKKLVLH